MADDVVEVTDEESSVQSTGTAWDHFQETGKLKFSFRKLWMFTGPGFLMSIAYLDPGNLEADLQLGASGKYELLWVLLLATIMGLILQNIASKLAVVSGRHLAQHCTAYPTSVKYMLWVMMEIAVICADCQEVVGSAIAINLLSKRAVPLWAGCLITAADCFLFMLLDRNGIRRLEALFGVFITTMVVTFGFQYFSQLPPQDKVLEGTFVPRMSSNRNFQTSVGLIGAVIMPHNLYLHSALVLSRKVDRNFEKEGGQARYRVTEALFYNRMESSLALGLSFVINLFVVAVFAHLAYYRADGTAVCTYDNQTVVPVSDDCDNIDGDCIGIGLLTAGKCLTDVYNEEWWLYIWALGVLAAGQASTITGTYAGQFIMEGFLDLRVKPAMRTFISRTFSLIPAMAVALATPGQPGGMDNLNEWLNVVQSFQLPFAMLPVMYFASSQRINGEFATMGWYAVVAWVIAVIVLVSNAYEIYLTALDLPNHWYVWILFSVLLAGYIALVTYLLLVTARVITFQEEPEAPKQLQVLGEEDPLVANAHLQAGEERDVGVAE
eukprot:TRINITY_DN38044_c0_g1_i1.p1 TRINITY_DN38044_c0_g1~~TRINITY_DN38044_c0_g1_i1.p1  ORF type:complete len:587 (+),score=253.52 TRINITY_DN38044_c0_g1_i1:109-1761(+)